MTRTVHRAFGLAATAAVLAALVWGFLIVESPEVRRRERMDERRIHDLQGIAAEIATLVRDPVDRRRLREPLPASLEDLLARARHRKPSIVDPETGAPYEYRVSGPSTYVLCATFSRPRTGDYGVSWNHAAGRHCFAIDVLDLR